MKQFCGLGKEEPLSSWSNSEHPLTVIQCVVCDFWKSEVLENNLKMSILLFFPSFSVGTNFSMGQKYADTDKSNISFLAELWSIIMLSHHVPFVWSKACLWWSSHHTGRSNDINIRNQKKPSCRPPRFA